MINTMTPSDQSTGIPAMNPINIKIRPAVITRRSSSYVGGAQRIRRYQPANRPCQLRVMHS